MNDNNSMAGMRKVYQLDSLDEKDVEADPIKQFEKWWNDALQSETEEPNAMTLATCTATGRPSARIVLLKGISENGFVFFTNYDSRKGRQISENAYAALVFFWKKLERQIRIEGTVKRTSEKESDEYFAVRPRESQLGAWSSPQSRVIEDAAVLQGNMKKNYDRFHNKDVPRPRFWGGYRVEPDVIEFWQGKPGRLHDRLQYSLDENKNWILQRLAP